MDIALLSKMVGELILDHEEVGLPGLGTFIAEMVPAGFSDRGYTINPPYKRLTFLPSQSEDDSLVALYSGSNGIDYDQAKAILQHFLEDTRRRLIEEKTVVFPGLGRLRSTRQNNFFFICDEELNIFPDGFGLAPVSLKNHEVSAEEVHEAVSGLVNIVEGGEETAFVPEPEPVIEPVSLTEEEPELIEVAESEAAGAAEDPAATEAVQPDGPVNPAEADKGTQAEAKTREGGFAGFLKVLLISILILIVLAAIALATFLILVQVAPDFIDSILYTEEELRIINY